MENKELVCYAVGLFDLIFGGYTIFIVDTVIRLQILTGVGIVAFIGLGAACVLKGLQIHGEIKV
jgi:hypothetical protein